MSDRLIVLVDTDSTDVDRLTQQLSAFGYGVDHCRNVPDIGERITAREPSVLIVRVDSGPASGSVTTIETVARILTDGDHKTPTIFLADDFERPSSWMSLWTASNLDSFIFFSSGPPSMNDI